MRELLILIFFCFNHPFGFGQKLPDKSVWIIDSTFVLSYKGESVKSNLDIPISGYTKKGDRLILKFNKKMVKAYRPDLTKVRRKAKFKLKLNSDSSIQLIGKNYFGKILFSKPNTSDKINNNHSLIYASILSFSDSRNWIATISDSTGYLKLKMTNEYIQKIVQDSVVSIEKHNKESSRIFEGLIKMKPKTIGFIYKDSDPILIKVWFNEFLMSSYFMDCRNLTPRFSYFCPPPER